MVQWGGGVLWFPLDVKLRNFIRFRVQTTSILCFYTIEIKVIVSEITNKKFNQYNFFFFFCINKVYYCGAVTMLQGLKIQFSSFFGFGIGLFQEKGYKSYFILKKKYVRKAEQSKYMDFCYQIPRIGNRCCQCW